MGGRRRCSALTRRGVGAHYKIVNCAPAKGCVWPDIGRHRRLCARGLAARRCGSVGAFCAWIVSVMRFYWNVLRLITPAILFYWSVLRSVHACLFSFVRKKETACGILRSYSAGRDRHSCVLAALFGYLPLWVHFGFGCFFMAISTGLRPESAIRKGTPFSCNVPFAINL